MAGAVGFAPTSTRFKGEHNRLLYETPIKVVGIVGLEPTEAERPSDLQSLAIAAMRYAH